MGRPKLYAEKRIDLHVKMRESVKKKAQAAAAKAGITTGQWIEQAAQEKLERK